MRSCKSQPCLNEGQCLDNALGGYTCLCPETYRGILCEEGKFIVGGPCEGIERGTVSGWIILEE